MSGRPVHVESYFASLEPIFAVVDETLNAWIGEGCYQFPALLGMIQIKMSWDDKELRSKDPLIRDYIRNHPDWYVTRGAHGGIMKMSEKQKKEAVREAKEKAKAEINAQLDAEVTRKKAEAQAAIEAAKQNTNDTNNS